MNTDIPGPGTKLTSLTNLYVVNNFALGQEGHEDGLPKIRRFNSTVTAQV
jgi:hypothetical protein